MSTNYSQTRVKTENRANYTSKIFPRSQGNNYRLAYPSNSPSTYYSKIQSEKEIQPNNLNLGRYSRQQKDINIEQNSIKKSPRISYNLNQYQKISEKLEKNQNLNQRSFQEKSYEPSQRSTNHSFFVSDFSKYKINTNQDKNNDQKPSYTLRFPIQTKLNEKYLIDNNKDNTNNEISINNVLHNDVISSSYNSNNYNIINNSNIINSISNNLNNSNIISNLNNNKNRYDSSSTNNINYKERKTTTHINNLRYDKDKDKKLNEPTNKREYTNKSYQGIKFPPKYYRNNPLIRNNIDNNNQINQNIDTKMDTKIDTKIDTKTDKKKEKTQTKPVAQKICNIIIKGGKQNENNSHINKRKKNIEYEEENANTNNVKNKNMNSIQMLIQRAQSIEQPRDKSKSNVLPKKNKKILKIEKLKNSNFELKKVQTGTVIEMQKAQSFEQPREFNYIPKTKNKATKYEISNLKDCGVELIGKANPPIDNKPIIELNNKKRNIIQNRGEKKIMKLYLYLSQLI
jgi:hypothetical protein